MMTSSFLARAGGPWQRCRGQSEKRATSTAPIAETARASVAAVEAGRPTHRRARRAAIFQGQVLNPSLLLLFLKGTPQRFLLTAVRTARVVSASRFLGHRAPGRSHHRHCCACCFLDAQAARVMEALESLATLRRFDPTTDTTSRHLVSSLPHLLAAGRPWQSHLRKSRLLSRVCSSGSPATLCSGPISGASLARRLRRKARDSRYLDEMRWLTSSPPWSTCNHSRRFQSAVAWTNTDSAVSPVE